MLKIIALIVAILSAVVNIITFKLLDVQVEQIKELEKDMLGERNDNIEGRKER